MLLPLDKPVNVLALDPGESVGWARATVAPDGTWSELRHGITPLKDMALAIHRALDYQIVPRNWAEPPLMGDEGDIPYDVVVMESWRLYPHKAKEFAGSSFPSVQFVGMVRLCCWLSDVPLVMQGASIKRTADKWMERLDPDLHKKVTAPGAHTDTHDLDALRHLFFWTQKEYSK